MRVRTTCLITAALGATGSLGALYDGPSDVLDRTYDSIVVGGTSSHFKLLYSVTHPVMQREQVAE